MLLLYLIDGLLHLAIAIVWSMAYQASTSPLSGNLTDHLALLSFKSFITEDPYGALDEWNDTTNFCQWPGIICGNPRRHQDRVISLDLPALNLSGLISPSLANLTYLRRLHIPGNRLKGRIPPELGGITKLQYLNLSMNFLEGEIPSSLCKCLELKTISLKSNMLGGSIPPNISLCSSLQILGLGNNKLVGIIPMELGFLSNLTQLHLYNNYLEGNIPAELGLLSKLRIIDLKFNHLSGRIPSSMGNLSSLVELSLQSNELSGSIPSELGRLSKLTLLHLRSNLLSGQIPSSLGNLSSLEQFRLLNNSLTGSIPTDLGRLTNLRVMDISFNQISGDIPTTVCNFSYLYSFHVGCNNLSGVLPFNFGSYLPVLEFLYLYENQLHGSIPLSLTNASMLKVLQLSNNRFSGQVPSNLGALATLSVLNLDGNKLMAKEDSDWNFFTSLNNCSLLLEIDLSVNMFRGEIPTSLVNLSTTLQYFQLQNNSISGKILLGIENLRNLVHFSIDNNLFDGVLPSNIGKLSELVYFSVSNNSMSGEIPYSLGELTGLNELYLDQNKFTGEIPDSLGNLNHLVQLDLSHNNLSGAIPGKVIGLSSLSGYLNISNNFLVGSVPNEVERLINLKALDVSDNQLSGTIPDGLRGCEVLEYLDMSSNSFQGTISHALNSLRGLQLLNLSHNHLCGPIPYFLENFPLMQRLDLSFNDFEGQVPESGAFSNASLVSVVGNEKLCGGIPELHLQSCRVRRLRRGNFVLTISLVIASSVLISIIMLFFLYKRLMKKKSQNDLRTVSLKQQYLDITYNELFKATDGFSSANIIGIGSFGSVYKGILDMEEKVFVAVKVLHCLRRGAESSFKAECKILRNIRHRNLLRVLTSCSSIDSSGNDFMALVFEYMHNGSLDSWLHSNPDDQSKPRNLILSQRISIAFDVALALDYLHTQGHVPIVHCDLKPSNILLNENMTACVGDFGLARFLSVNFGTISESTTTSVGIKGTIGYIPPEYGMGSPVSIEGDVFSYGITILEMLTGKRPTDETFNGELNIRTYVEQKYPERLMEIIDPKLHLEDFTGTNEVQERCLINFIGIGLACSKVSARERMGMKDVLNQLHSIRDLQSRS